MLNEQQVEMMQKVKAHILAEKNRLVMSTWMVNTDEGKTVEDMYCHSTARESRVPSCGTVGCIAGWLTALNLPVGAKMDGGDVYFADRESVSVGTFARELLAGSMMSHSMLFFVDQWPREMRNLYVTAETPEQKTDAAIQMIDWWTLRA